MQKKDKPGDPNIVTFRHKDGPKITKVNETIFTIFPLFSRCFITLLPVVSHYRAPLVVHESDSALQDLLWPDRLQTERGILWTMAPHTPAQPAGHWVVLLETPVLSQNLSELLHAPASTDANTRVKEPDAARCPGHLKTEKKTFARKKTVSLNI